MRRALLAIAVIAASNWAIAQTVDPHLFDGLSYRLIGPFRAGRSLACTGVPGNLEKYFMGAVGGGVWVTENSGRTWTPIMDGVRVASIGAIAVAPSNPSVVYVGAGEADMRADIQQGDGLYKSVDAGKTWKHVGLDDTRQIAKIVVDPKDPDTVYVAALGHQYGPNDQRGVFKSTDGGATWTKTLFVDDNTGAVELAMDPSDPSLLIAGMWQTRRPPWEIYPPSSGPGSGMYRSADAGKTWTKISGHGLPSFFGRIGLSFSPAQPNRVYAVIDTNGETGGGIFVSDDKGENWTKTTGDNRLWGRGWYFCGITADPKDADTVYLMNTGMYRSTDGGKTFIPIKSAPGGDDYHTLWVNPEDTNRMIAATDQGTIVSVDRGLTWSSWWNQPTGQFYHAITDSRFPYWVYGSQQDSGAMAVPSRTNHDNINMRDWRPMSAGGESGTIAPDRLHPGTVIDDGGSIERLDDGWHKEVDPTRGKEGGPWRKTWTQPIAASPIDPKVFYIGRQVVFRSGDSGDSWQIISPDLSRKTNTVPANLDAPTASDIDQNPRQGVVFWIAPSPVKRGEIWTGTDDGLIWITRDEGAHWEDVTPPDLTPWSKVGIIDASHFDANTAYAAIDRHRLDDNKPYIYRTHDGGKHWDLITNGLPAGEFVNVVREDPVRKGLLYAGTDWGIFVSFDDGANWQSLQLNLPPASIRDLAFGGNDLIVGTHGRAFWILDDLSPLRQISASTTETTLFRPSPAVAFIRGPGFDDGTPLPMDEPRGENPPNGAILDYFLAKPVSLVELRITDGKGKEIAKFSSADKSPEPDIAKLTITPNWIRPRPGLSIEAGGHRFVWGFGESMPTGTYTATLVVDGKSYSRPLLVVSDPRLDKK
ncbi:MAG TPA: hypothetical protein VHE55_17775 [Fimbriimonadaceae bacterium]|nr:hypothetical protein [Fimbriimonadaceae bacterium]